MLQRKGGSGDFSGPGTVLSAGSRFSGFLPIAQSPLYQSWPWTSKDSTLWLRNRKVTSSGPKSDGWWPCRPYIRSVAISSVTGTKAFYKPRGSVGRCYGSRYVPGNILAIYCDKFGEFLPNLAAAPYAPSELYDRAMTEMLVKLADRKVHLGNALAESRRTVSLVANRTIQVLSAYRALRRGRIRDAANLLGVRKPRSVKSLSGAWLEWQYGWKPLLSDIYGASEKLREVREGRSLPIVRVVRQVRAYSSNPSSSGSYPTYKGGCNVIVRALAFYKVEDNFARQLSTLGLINPLEIAWELTPWSFVVDWFLPVGNWLTALTADSGMDYVDGCFSTVARGVWEIDISDAPFDTPESGSIPLVKDLTVKNEAFAFQRTPFTSPPSARLYMKSPFSTIHVTNAIALITQLKR